MVGMKEACEKVLEMASEQGVRFPKTWSGEEEKTNKMKAVFELLSVTDKTRWPTESSTSMLWWPPWSRRSDKSLPRWEKRERGNASRHSQIHNVL